MEEGEEGSDFLSLGAMCNGSRIREGCEINEKGGR